MNMTHRSTRAKDLQYEGWKIQVANICLEWALTNDKPLIFDEILEEEEEDKILENEILENKVPRLCEYKRGCLHLHPRQRFRKINCFSN